MAKKIKKGNPIEELVKGSIEYTMREIQNAFRAQFPMMDMGYWYIVDTFSDFIVVGSYYNSSDKPLKSDEYYKITYSKNGETYTFASQDQWEVVELAYQPQTTVVAEGKKRKGKKFEERVNAPVTLLEREEGKPRKIKIDGAIQAGVVNGNGRRYPSAVLKAAVA